MKEKEVKKKTGPKKLPAAPPDYLMRQTQIQVPWEEPDVEDVKKAQDDLDLWSKEQLEIGGLQKTGGTDGSPKASTDASPKASLSASPGAYIETSEPVQFKPRNVDYLTYQQAVEDRISAETSYGEIYSKYLDLLHFNEKTIRTIRRFQKY